jgi:hypothetical protein
VPLSWWLRQLPIAVASRAFPTDIVNANSTSRCMNKYIMPRFNL